jgi:hypothetical protein
MRRPVLIFLALLFAGLVAAAWYASDKGFTKKWRQFVTSEFRKRGLEISMRRLNLVPFRGIVAKEVRLYDARDRNRTLAVVDEILLVINYANLFQGKTFVDALELRDATLALPLDPGNRRSPRVEINALSGRLFLPPQQIYLSRLEAQLYGMQVTASGRLINPQAFAAGEESKLSPVEIIDRIIKELRTLQFEDAAPQLDFRFGGDLAQPETLQMSARFAGAKIRRGDYRLETLNADASYHAGILDVKQLTATDAHGELRLTGTYELASGEARLRLSSGLDLQALTRSLEIIPELNAFICFAPPQLELSADLRLREGAEFLLIGRLAQQRFAYKTVTFESFTADFSWDGKRWSARDVELMHESGAVTGDLMEEPGNLRTRLKSTMKPEVLQPLLTERTAEWFSRIEFTGAPVAAAESE